MRKTITSILTFSLLICLLAGCGGPEPASVPASTAAPAAASAAPETPAADAPSAAPLPDGRVLAKTSDDTPDEVLTAWFKEVYEKVGT